MAMTKQWPMGLARWQPRFSFLFNCRCSLRYFCLATKNQRNEHCHEHNAGSTVDCADSELENSAWRSESDTEHKMAVPSIEQPVVGGFLGSFWIKVVQDCPSLENRDHQQKPQQHGSRAEGNGISNLAQIDRMSSRSKSMRDHHIYWAPIRNTLANRRAPMTWTPTMDQMSSAIEDQLGEGWWGLS